VLVVAGCEFGAGVAAAGCEFIVVAGCEFVAGGSDCVTGGADGAGCEFGAGVAAVGGAFIVVAGCEFVAGSAAGCGTAGGAALVFDCCLFFREFLDMILIFTYNC